jgi:inositol oxygenase
LSIQEAIAIARGLPADPLAEAGPSLRTLSFATAEQARNEGHPDWVQFVALIRGLACVVKRHEIYATSENTKEFDWTVTNVESRVVGCKATDCSAYSEFNWLNSDEKDMRYNTYLGRYQRSTGLESVLLSWSSSEYMYYMLKYNKVTLPEEAYKLLKLSSLVDWHSRGQYKQLSNMDDECAKQSIADFHDMCERANLFTQTTGQDFSDERCQFLWESHFAFVVRKYASACESLSW